MAKNDAPKGVDQGLFDKIKSIYGTRGHQTDLQKRRTADLEQRVESATILHPDDVKGDYDVKRMLETTLGGKKRMLTQKDLIAFKKNIATAKQRYNGGITPQKIINLSMDADIARSREQIKTAVFSRRNPKGEAFFVTNSSPDSKHNHHTVHVIFKQFGEALTAAGDTPNLVKYLMQDGRVAFDCTCERHRYWFRYITTIGEFYAGRPETGFPKITNPNLAGVACKHVICVMTRIQSPAMRGQFVAWLRSARVSQDSKSVQATAKEMKAEAIKQAQTSHYKRNQAQRKEDAAIFKVLQASKVVPPNLKAALDSLDATFKDGFITKNAYNKGVKMAYQKYGVK